MAGLRKVSWRLVPVGYDDPAVGELERQVQQEYARRYGTGDDTALAPQQFRPPAGIFLLGMVDGIPAAMGGWRVREGDGAHLRDGDAEMKRMYVVPAEQRHGHARALLTELEQTAAAAGRLRMVLETGLRQPEAITLYTSSGYTEMGKFGLYAHEESSRYFAKELAG